MDQAERNLKKVRKNIRVRGGYEILEPKAVVYVKPKRERNYFRLRHNVKVYLSVFMRYCAYTKFISISRHHHLPKPQNIVHIRNSFRFCQIVI